MELALLAAHQGQFNRCQAIITTAAEQFRQDWAGLHPLSQAKRAQVLARLQPLAELQVSFLIQTFIPMQLSWPNLTWQSRLPKRI